MDRLIEDKILLKLASCCTLSLLHSDSQPAKSSRRLQRFILILSEYHSACIESLTKSTDLITALKPDLDLVLTGFDVRNPQRWCERDEFLSKCQMDPFVGYPLEAVKIASQHDLFSSLLRSMKIRLRTPKHVTNKSLSAPLTFSTIALDRLVREVKPLSLGHSQDIERTLYCALESRTFCRCQKEDSGHLKKVMFRCPSIGQNFENSDQPQFGVLLHAARAKCVKIGCAHSACHHETDFKVDLHRGSFRILKEIQLSLCEKLHRNHSRKLNFLVTRDRDLDGERGRLVYRMYRETKSDQRIAPIKTLKLARALRTMRSNHDKRGLLKLAYIVALGVWQYCNTKWMHSAWKPSEFCFVDERNSKTGKVTSYPYISISDWRLDRDGKPAPDDHNRISIAAHYPCLMSLGMLLIDIGLGAHQAAWDDLSTMDSICLAAHRILSAHRNEWHLRHLEDIASSCFNNKLFVSLADSIGNESLRSLIFKEIVRPLELVYRASMGEELQCNHDGNLHSAKYSIEDADADADADAEEALRQRLEENEHLLGSSLTPDQWITQNFDIPNLKLSDMIKERRIRNITNPPPIKVAILDTGCDGNSRYFTNWPRSKQRVEKNWVDFVQAGSKSLTDTDVHKHGTKITTLVLKLLPKAELYVGRVTREEKGLKDSLGIIKQAIEHAVNIWDVDIISMSWGFDYETEEISQVIHKAVGIKNRRVLFFAAAGNDGPNKKLMFPASNENVIAVGHTNTMGDFQGLPAQDGADFKTIYGTLGVDIPYDAVTKETITGSSFATPIMAASAALLLQDVSLLTYENPEDFRTVQRCFEREAMVNLIGGTRVNGRRGVYVAPARFFERNERARRGEFLHTLGKMMERR